MLKIRRLRWYKINEDYLSLLSQFRETNITVEQAIKLFRKSKPIIYVAILDDKFVGSATLILEQKFIHNAGIVGHIEDVVVHKEYRKLGIGKKLIEKIIQRCREVKAYKAILGCEFNVSTFYEKLGFNSFNQGMRLEL